VGRTSMGLAPDDLWPKVVMGAPVLLGEYGAVIPPCRLHLDSFKKAGNRDVPPDGSIDR
jgi:hypothetical protein